MEVVLQGGIAGTRYQLFRPKVSKIPVETGPIPESPVGSSVSATVRVEQVKDPISSNEPELFNGGQLPLGALFEMRLVDDNEDGRIDARDAISKYHLISRTTPPVPVTMPEESLKKDKASPLDAVA